MSDSNSDQYRDVRKPFDPLVYFAAERTLLVWIRTGSGLVGLGFVVDRFGLFLREMFAKNQPLPYEHLRLSLWIGVGLIFLGAIVNLIACVTYIRFARRYARGDNRPGVGVSLGAGLSIIMAIVAVVMVIYLILVNR